MTEEIAAGITPIDDDSCTTELLNPFVHHLELESTSEKIKTAVLTILLLPLRVAVICFLLITGWVLACIGLWGITEEELQSKPITGWRSCMRVVASHLILWIFYVGGFRLKIIGNRAERTEASVIALAPHSSFIDSIAMVYMSGPSIVAKGETAAIPFFGTTYRAGGMQIVIKGKQASRQEAPMLVIAPHSTFLDGGIVYFTGFPSIIVRRESGTNPYIGTTYRAGGMEIVIKGKQADRQDAPVLVIAPHSTFLDAGIVYFTGFPSSIVRTETGANPYVGKLINFTQPVYVWRDDPNSRQNTIKEIISRAKSDLDWPQILIFPEGTCTNRSCLITFKPGAFYPGVPVQPVCIRYPNKLDTVTWTWEGPSALKLLWLTLSQVYSSCEIEFLPVYNPNEEEKKDPKLFAYNVRAVMAKALGVPVMDYTYDDCKLITRAKEMNLPNANALLEVQKIRHKLRLDESRTEDGLIDSKILCQDCSRTTIVEFSNYLNVPCTDPLLQQLFKLYDKNSTGVIDFREYLLGVLGLPLNRSIIETVKIAFRIYDCTGQGKIPAEDFAKILSHTLAMPYSEALEAFWQIATSKSDCITFEQLSSYLQQKAEFAGLFTISKEEKIKSRNGEICPNDFKKNN